jgi:hypothetical protein
MSLHDEDENPGKELVMTEPQTHTLAAPGAALHFDVRSNDASTEPACCSLARPWALRDSSPWPGI